MDEIKKLNDEPTQPKMTTPYKSTKTTKKPSRPEIEELDKRFRAIKRSKGKKGVRKLYNHEVLIVKEITQNVNIESSKMSQNDERLGKKMPMRLAKKSNFSYAY